MKNIKAGVVAELALSTLKGANQLTSAFIILLINKIFINFL